jgi:hypothetical protein
MYKKIHAVQGKIRNDNLRLLHVEIRKKYLLEKLRPRKHFDFKSPENDQVEHSRLFTSGLLSFGHEVYGQIALSKGVEPRSPYSDRRMIEFAIQMPLKAKLFSN